MRVVLSNVSCYYERIVMLLLNKYTKDRIEL